MTLQGAEYEVLDDSQEHWWKVKDENGYVLLSYNPPPPSPEKKKSVVILGCGWKASPPLSNVVLHACTPLLF